MARKKNQQNKPDFKAFVKELKSKTSPRPTPSKITRKYFLIVTEGEKTEPNYFYSLISLLPNHLVQVEIQGEGTDTIAVVEATIKHRKKRTTNLTKPPFDEVWAVFDKDDFPAERFNEAVELAQKENIGTAYSNEAFELWYVLHFQFLQSAITRKEYIKILEKILGNYQKNDPDIYSVLLTKGDEDQAIKWAEKLFQELSKGNPAIEKPVTRIYELVKNLNRFKP